MDVVRPFISISSSRYCRLLIVYPPDPHTPSILPCPCACGVYPCVFMHACGCLCMCMHVYSCVCVCAGDRRRRRVHGMAGEPPRGFLDTPRLLSNLFSARITEQVRKWQYQHSCHVRAHPLMRGIVNQIRSLEVSSATAF